MTEFQVSDRPAPVRVAVIGCGAVTQGFHLPVLAGHSGLTVTALVDPDVAKATKLASLYRIPGVLSSMDQVNRQIADAALVATPSFLHAQGSIDLMRRGLHVLVEKPMALSHADAEHMVSVAREHGVVLTVGLYRRLLPAIRLFRAALDAGEIGNLVSVDAEVGDSYTWQLTTLAGMERRRAGGGILVDMGPHVVDLVLYLCNGMPELIEYADNASEGIETDCAVKFRVNRPEGAIPVRVELSRTRKLRNTIRAVGTSGSLEWRFGERSRVLVSGGRRFTDTLTATVRPHVVETRWSDEVEQLGYEGFRAQIDDLIDAITGTAPPQLSGESVVPNVKLLEECYQQRTALDEPWFQTFTSLPAVHAPATTNRRVLITGASGFIGCRLAEWLHFGSTHGVRALIRSPSRAVRLARMPIEFAIGDLASPDHLAKAMDGCDSVVHAGIGTSWRRSERIAINVKGTKNLVDAALRAGVKRFVHISTLSVYGDRAAGIINESTPVNPKKGWDYAESKLEAERIVLEAASRGLPAVVLRVAVVYGAHNMTVVVRPLQHLVQDRLFLLNCGTYPSNTIYVDNLCEGIRLALDAGPEINGDMILLSDDDGCTWGEYFGYFAARLGATVHHVSQSPVRASGSSNVSLGRRWLQSTQDLITSSEVKGLAKRIYLSDPWGTPARWFIDTFPDAARALKDRIRPEEGMVYRPIPAPDNQLAPFVVDPISARVDTAKAQRILGYRSVVPRSKALELTLAWARYARIVPDLATENTSVEALSVR